MTAATTARPLGGAGGTGGGPARPVTVVVDSTSDIPLALRESLGMVVVPLTVQFGEESFRDGVDLDQAAFLARLTSAAALPTTSQPPTTSFEDAFRRAIDGGRDVLCVTIAAGLSGTANAARLAAEAVAPERIRVVETGTVSMGAGWVAVTAARAARSGATLAEATAAADAAIPRCRVFAVLETLEYLQKGGRIGRASQMIGSMLSIKPILGIHSGAVHPVERVRTWRKAIDRLAALAEDEAPLDGLAVMHVGNERDARALADRLAHLTPDGTVVVNELGPVVATYAGPGCVGVAPLLAG
ncbi:MAG: DegV family protein [uncultured Thermomicrobiales bacterium]|uniref:DegV family protein n=1 Tax=uncultured Thermomicrobiales bacterium TaxID=1645740 RepID=A0A6J4USN9_9BACT|nr:MAG: DegV family protein [uncultured Thermomicrobiales bacterium]